MTDRHKNLLTLAVSTALCALVVVLALESRRPTETVELVDDREAVEALLAERARNRAGPPSEGSEPAAGSLVREPIPESEALRLFPAIGGKRAVYDPDAYFRGRSGIRRWTDFPEHPAGGFYSVTNSIGLREEEEISAARPDLRVLVTGDSHTEGVVGVSESFANVLEALLASRAPGAAIESLNAGKGGYSLYNYLGVLEKFAALEVDVFVVAVFGGNDFAGSLRLYRYFNRLPEPRRPSRPPPPNPRGRGLFAQQVGQALYFRDLPDEEGVALEVARAVTREIQRQCAARGVALVVVYIPPFGDAQPALIQDEIDEYLATYQLTPAGLHVADRLADSYLEFLAGQGIPYVDMRPAFSRREEPVYWRADHHVNVLGHRLIAEALLPLVERLRPTSPG